MTKTFPKERKTKMRKLLIIGAAALAAAASQGSTGNLPRLDSSKFDFKYEMEVLPSEQDLDQDGAYDFTKSLGGQATLVPTDGYAVFDASTGNCYLLSGAASGEVGGAWQRYGVTAATGFTIEVRMIVRYRVSVDGSTYATAISASVPDSTSHALLNFTADKVFWGDTVLTNMQLSTEFHTWRIAKGAGSASGYSVWCDGNLVGSNLGSGANWGTDNRIILGAMGWKWRGASWVSYLRFTKGGYAPPKEKDMRRDSADFNIKYEMDSVPASFVQKNTVTTSSDGGVTRFNFAERGYYEGNSDWSAFSAQARSYGYTMELRAKVVGSTLANGICLTASDNTDYDTFLLIKNSGLAWGPYTAITTITNLDTTADFHVYRIVKEPDNNRFSFYCDGNLVSDALTDGMSGKDNRFLFGAIGGGYGGTIDVDYLRYTSGVWYPYVPPPGFVLFFK
ncbi:MAG: hypothetical protein IJH50_10720 [Kiritimatiellae bacterium]|nr:hypothetical protein [Kiritimatiellia bacterium]